MRVTSELWVAALIRRAFSSGGFAAVVKRGAMEAGAIFLIERGRMGESALYGPAPQTSYGEGPADRRLTALGDGLDDAAIEERMAKEQRFDPDLWLVEVEPGQTPLGELVEITTP